MSSLSKHGGVTLSVLNIIVEKAECNYSAYVKEIDGIATSGQTIGETLHKMYSAINDYIDCCVDKHLEIPLELKDKNNVCLYYKGVKVKE